MKDLIKRMGLPIAAGILAGWFTGEFWFGMIILVVFLFSLSSHDYREYAKNNPQNLWFKRKWYGWGWMPVRWQGWLSIAAYAGLIAFFFVRADAKSHSLSDTLYGVFIPFIILTIIFTILLYLKGEKPGWQWGPPQQ